MQGFRLCVFWYLLLSATSSFGNTFSIERQAVSDLQSALPQAQQRELELAEGGFLLLSLQAMTSYQKGTVILVPDWYQHAASPKHINSLRQQLTEYGWNTLAIMPPTDTVTDPTDSAQQPYSQALKSRIEKTQQLAEQNPGVIVVIAQGASAAVLNTLYAEQALAQPAAFIMLSAYLPDAEQNRAWAKSLADHAVPTLDISHIQDNRFVAEQLKLRRQLVEKHLKAIYRQRLLAGSSYNNDWQQWVLQEIYGWLSSVGL